MVARKPPSTTVAIDSEAQIGVSVDGLSTDGEVSEQFAELEELLLEPFAEDLSLTLGQSQQLGEGAYVVEDVCPKGTTGHDGKATESQSLSAWVLFQIATSGRKWGY